MVYDHKGLVKLCKDVIAQIKIGALKATSGVYVESKRLPRFQFEELCSESHPDYVPALNQLAKDLKRGTEGVSCDVCAKGALFIKALERGKADAEEHSARRYDWAEQFMSSVMFREIESAFEGFNAFSWGARFPSDKRRLVAIMLTIIRNEGKSFYADDDILVTKKDVTAALRPVLKKPTPKKTALKKKLKKS